uniref:Reelin domain-containing protein n=1 Tax=Octopus bimaculoides TaxID=37653 RepID=A0A0L8HYN0_OCTBM
MRLSIAFALLSLSLCQAENNSSDTGRILDGSWSSEENLVLTFDQRNNSLSATLIISCSRGYNFTGNITNSNTFHLYGAFNTTAMAVTGQLYKTNQNKILKITLMKYDYANCTNYTPTKISFHELKPSQNISKSTATQTSYNWYNYLVSNIMIFISLIMLMI